MAYLNYKLVKKAFNSFFNVCMLGYFTCNMHTSIVSSFLEKDNSILLNIYNNIHFITLV